MATAKEIVKVAASQIGTVEKPPNSNKVKYNTWYYGRAVSGAAYPWCCAFVNWVFYKCDAMKLFNDGKKSAYCPEVVNWAKRKEVWLGRTKNPKAGDLVFFHNGNGEACHIGIVEKKINDTTVQTIEGNTSFGTTSNSGGSQSQSNGGAVARRTRYYNTSGFKILGFARPAYAESTTTKEPVKDTTTTTIPAKTAVKTVSAKSGLNVRQKNNTSSKVLATLPYGTKVTILKEKSGWGQISYNGKKGWIYLYYTK